MSEERMNASTPRTFVSDAIDYEVNGEIDYTLVEPVEVKETARERVDRKWKMKWHLGEANDKG